MKEKLSLEWMSHHLSQQGINEVISRIGKDDKPKKSDTKQQSEALRNIKKVISLMGGKKIQG